MSLHKQGKSVFPVDALYQGNTEAYSATPVQNENIETISEGKSSQSKRKTKSEKMETEKKGVQMAAISINTASVQH